MEIEVLGKKWNINNIMYKDRRELHKIHSQSYAKAVINKTNEIDWNYYYDAIDFALSVAFSEPEKSLEGLSDSDIDKLGQEIIKNYLNIEKKVNGGVV